MTLVIVVVAPRLLDSYVRLKSFLLITSGSVARLGRCCCAIGVVVLAVEVTVADVVVVDVVVFIVTDAGTDACTAGLEYISVVLGHSLDQSVSGVVVITLTPFGCSFLFGMTIVY
jgi:hypothetical protein